MKISNKFYWQQAYQVRCCPPDSVLFSPYSDYNTKIHTNVCSSCKKRLEGANHGGVNQELSAIAAILAKKLAENSVNSKNNLLPGQIWKLSSKLGGWGDNLKYMNPPIVMLLTESKSLLDSSFLVAQLHDSKALVGVGDVELEEAIGYVESWNTYTVKSKHLEYCIGEVGPNILSRVQKEVCSCIAVYNDEYVEYFREMELEIGKFISRQSVLSFDWLTELFTAPEKLINELTEQFKSWRFPKELLDSIRNANPDTSSIQDLVLQLVACAIPQEGLLRGSGEVEVQANLLVISEQGFDPRLALIKITSFEWTSENQLDVTGRINLNDTGHVERVEAWWVATGKQPVIAELSKIDKEEGIIILNFNGIDRSESTANNLKIVLFAYA